MRRRFVSAAPFLAIAGCSALVQINDEDYLGPNGPSLGGQSMDSGGDSSPPSLGGMGGSFGIGDEVDLDGDGEPDGTLVDSNGDGIVDSVDTDGDGIGDVDFTPGGSGGSSSGGSSSGGNNATGGEDPGGLPDPVYYYPLDGDPDNASATMPSWPAQITEGANLRTTGGLIGGAYEVAPLAAGATHYLGTNSVVGATNPFTLSFWFIPSADNFYTLVSKTDHLSSTRTGWQILIDNGIPRLRIGPSSDEEYIIPDTTLPLTADGEWTHMVFGYHEDQSGTRDLIKLWINGELVFEESYVSMYDLLSTNADIRFGYQENMNISRFSGVVDEIRIYDVLLTDDEVHELHDSIAP